MAGETPASPEYCSDGDKYSDQANSIETEIRAVRLALEHYRAALDVEKSVSARPA